MRYTHPFRPGIVGMILIATTTAGMVGNASAPVLAAPGDFTVSPTTLSFPSTYIGATAEIGVTITNVSATAQTPNFAGGAPGDSTNFDGSQNCGGVTLDPGAHCTFTYSFRPKSTGALSSSTTIDVDNDSFSISMSGSGLFPITVAPTTLAFPDTEVGATADQDVVVTNISPVAQSPNFAGGAPGDSANFDASQNCGGVTLSSGSSCAFTYSFKPASPGAWSSSTTIDVDGMSFPISMSGTGTDSSATTTSSTTTTTSTSPTTTTATSNTSNSTAPPGGPNPTNAPGVGTPAGTLPALQGPGGQSPATGHAQVIAQGLVTFLDGPVRWDAQRLDPATWPYQFSDSPPMFLLDHGPDALSVVDALGAFAYLDAGEAVFVPAGSAGSMTPLFDGAVAAGERVTFVADGGPSSFTPGPAKRDVNVVRDVLAPGETFSTSSSFPVLVIVQEGSLTNVADPSAALGPDSATTLGTSVELRNDGDAPASVVAVVIGTVVA